MLFRSDGGLRLASLRLGGTARGTRIDATARPEANGRDIAGLLALDNADASLLVRQFGFEALPLAGVGRGRVSAELKGGFEQGFEATALADIAGTRLSYTGRLAGSPLSPEMKGLARATANDAAPFLRLMAFGLPDFAARAPVEASARVEVSDGKLGLGDIAGAVAGGKIRGDLAGAADPGAGQRFRLTGALALERASLPALATLVFGPTRAPRAGAPWSDARFAAGLAEAPLADVRISASEIALSDGVTGRDARFLLSLAPGLLQFRDRKSTRLNSSHVALSRMPSSA